MLKKTEQFKKNKQSEDTSDDYESTLPVSDESEEDINYTGYYSDCTETIPIIEEIMYPGLILKKDYILLKKIGCGNNASVWIIYQVTTKNFLAMKIQDHQCYHDGCREVVIIRKINSHCKENQDKKIYCINMLDYFVYEENEKTKYVCSTYHLYAGSVQMLLNSGKHKYGLPIKTVKQIAKQLLITLDVMHNDLKIIHTDIKPENILFKGIFDDHQKIMDSFINSEFQQKYKYLYNIFFADNNQRFVEELEILAIDSVQEICTLKTEINDEEFIPYDDEYDSDDYDSDDEGEQTSDIFNERKQSVDDILENLDYSDMHNLEKEGEYDFNSILNNRQRTTDTKMVIDDKYVVNCTTALIDFGNSYFFDKRTRNEIQDRRYRAPEIILDYNYDFACDIWSVACVIFELLTGFVLFEPVNSPLNKDIHHLFLMEKMLGTIPTNFKKESKRNKFLFDQKRNYHIKNVKPFISKSLEERLTTQFLFTKEESKEINDFLICGLEYDPLKRSTAKDLLKHPWLKNVDI